jgi:hypothetical protein
MADQATYTTRRQLADRLGRGESTLRRWLDRDDWPADVPTAPPWSEADAERIQAWETETFDPGGLKRAKAGGYRPPAALSKGIAESSAELFVTADAIIPMAREAADAAGLDSTAIHRSQAGELADRFNAEILSRLRQANDELMAVAYDDDQDELRERFVYGQPAYLAELAQRIELKPSNVLASVVREFTE